MSTPELSVVCKRCGSEVSPYVTECPYCGARVRRRAPKLEREGDEIRVREDRRARRRRRAEERRHQREERGVARLEGHPVVTIAAILAPAILLVLIQAGALTDVEEAGAIAGPVDDDWWRYLAAPFVYDDLGYLFACGVALAIFGTAIERRVGPFPTLLLLVACGALGMLAAEGLDTAFDDGFPVAAGGNGIALGALAAWLVLRDAERRADPTEEYDRIAVAVAAVVLLALPLVEDFASVWAGLAGAAVGAVCGLVAALAGRTAR